MNDFNVNYLCPHINYHRPCFFPEIKIDAKGKQRKTYPYKNMMTPYDKLKSLAGTGMPAFKLISLLENTLDQK
jgi:hypothetical protein